ncbi:hypothetical protein HY379_00930 [Candidatus Saccharibacteria bacterium]|nr:hypothetical protein [Candidatus Saccharibacteria bacterium]
MANSAKAVSSWFDVDYFFVKQLEVLKRGNTNLSGTHKHLTINPITLSHKHYAVNEFYPCSSYAFYLRMDKFYLLKLADIRKPVFKAFKRGKNYGRSGILNTPHQNLMLRNPITDCSAQPACRQTGFWCGASPPRQSVNAFFMPVVGDPLIGSLASVHNLRYLNRLCEEYRT